eukprot:scaffold48815_cov69-Phaeocystis_antarctica.AAC.3
MFVAAGLTVAGRVAVGHDQVERVCVDDVLDVRVLEAVEHLRDVDLGVYRTPLDSATSAGPRSRTVDPLSGAAGSSRVRSAARSFRPSRPGGQAVWPSQHGTLDNFPLFQRAG